MGQITGKAPSVAPPEAAGAATAPAMDATPEQTTLGNAAVQQKMKGTSADPLAPAVPGADSTLLDLAVELSSALHHADMPTLYRILSRGDRAAILEKYAKAMSGNQGFETDAHANLSEMDAITAISFAKNGKADLYCKVMVVTRWMYGTDEDTLFTLLETSPPADVLALVERDVTWLDELSGAQYRRAAQVLEPYGQAIQEHGGSLSAEARAAFLEEFSKEGPTSADLLAQLEARRGWTDDDEVGMLADVHAWAKKKGKQTEIDPVLLTWLEGQLSASQFVEAKNALRTGDDRTLDDKIDEAAAERSWFDLVANPDEQRMYDAIEEASADERSAWAGSDDAKGLGASIGESDAAHAMTLVAAPDKESAANLDDLLTALEGITYVSDQQVFGALDKMKPAELARLRSDPALRERIESCVSDVDAFHAVIGYTLPAVEGDDEAAGKAIAANTARMVARVELAAGSVPGLADTDALLRAVIDWQRAQGWMNSGGEDSALYARFADAAFVAFVDQPYWYSKLLGATHYDPVITDKDRLELATVLVLGTDGAATERSIEDVQDDELIRDWSNLKEFKEANANATPEALTAASAAWVPDIDAEVRGWLEGDQTDALTDIGKIREKLVAALNSPEGSKLAADEFGYANDERAFAVLQYRQADELQDRSRGDSWQNDVSSSLVDPFTGKGQLLDMAYGEFQGAAATAMTTERDSVEETPAFDFAEQERQDFLAAQQGYEELRSSTAEIAGTIVTSVLGVLVSIATAGTASPVAAALVGSLMTSAVGEMVKASISGEGYDWESGGVELTKALVTGLIAMPLEPLAKGLSGGIAGSAIAKAVVAGAEGAAPGVGGKLLKELGEAGLEAVVKDFPTSYVGAAIETEGLLRQGVDGAIPIFESTMQSKAVDLLGSAAKYKSGLDEKSIERLAHAGKWDDHLDQLVKAGIVDLAVTTAAERLISGEALKPEDFLELLCKTVDAVHGAHTDADEAKTSLGDALQFFNTASVDDLATAAGDPRLAATIVLERERKKFKSIDDLKRVPSFEHDVLLPAAEKVLADLEEKRTAASTTPA